MHIYTLDNWRHSHCFDINDGKGEKKTRQVIILTVIMMVFEITGGTIFGSMALLADGWHMGTHAIALGITLFAYIFARKNADNPIYSFGTGKVGILGGFTSAVVLALVALLMAAESVFRFIKPAEIMFNEAIGVAITGLIVNFISALLLQDRHDHSHIDNSGHKHDTHHDHNLKAAYLHVVADTLTSLLAIVALLAGKAFAWVWMDPFMGIVGAIIISRWSYGLLKDTGRILLDRDVNPEMISSIYNTIESDKDNRISDLHIWRIDSNHLYAIVSIVTHFPQSPDYYKKLLEDYDKLVHITVEVNQCKSEPCIVPKNKLSV